MNFKHIGKYLIAVAIIIIYMLCIIKLGSNKYDIKNVFPFYNIDSGWTVTENGESREIESLFKANIGLVNKHDSVTITTTIPDVSEIVSPCISFKTILSTADVYLDGELIYSYGHNTENKGLMVNKSYHYVPLSSSDSGKTISIVITGTENSAFSSFSNVYVGNISDVYNKYIQVHKIPFIIGFFLCIFALVLLVLSTYLISSSHKDHSIIFSSIISFLLGAYILGYNDVIILISDRLRLGTVLEYITLLYMPAAIIGFIITDNIGFNTVVTRFFLAVNVILPTIFVILHYTNICHICNFVSIFHFFAMIEGFASLCQFILIIIRKKKDKKKQINIENRSLIHSYSGDVLAIGLMIFIATATYEILIFNYQKYFSPTGDRFSVSVLTIGAIIFVMSLFLNFFFHNIDHYNSKALFSKLENIAYTDELTSLANRALSEKVLENLEKANANYAIISIDLDQLKLINDNYGHTCGDRYISNFARIIDEVFINSTISARIGGDEFLIALKDADEWECSSLLSKFETALIKESEASDEFTYKASYGFAIHKSKDKNIGSHEVYMLADKRMYDMKQEHHLNYDKEGEIENA